MSDVSRLIHVRFWRERQSYAEERILVLQREDAQGRDSHTLRATLKEDASPTQSFARVERWDGSQWQEVVTQRGETFPRVRGPYRAGVMPFYGHADEAAIRSEIEAVLAPLIELATKVVRS